MRERSIEAERNIDTLIWAMQQDIRVWEFINRNYHFDTERVHLLQEIILGIGRRKREDLVCLVYLYGSLLRKEDLIERQIFLWLQKMLEEDFCEREVTSIF